MRKFKNRLSQVSRIISLLMSLSVVAPTMAFSAEHGPARTWSGATWGVVTGLYSLSRKLVAKCFRPDRPDAPLAAPAERAQVSMGLSHQDHLWNLRKALLFAKGDLETIADDILGAKTVKVEDLEKLKAARAALKAANSAHGGFLESLPKIVPADRLERIYDATAILHKKLKSELRLSEDDVRTAKVAQAFERLTPFVSALQEKPASPTGAGTGIIASNSLRHSAGNARN